MKQPNECKDEEKWFRVSVCLERFFSDERARCFVSVSGERRVRWLRRRVRRLFALPAPARSLALLSQGHLLPPDEPLSLLRPDDVVHIIPTTIDFENTDSSEPICVSTNESIDISTPEPSRDRCKQGRKRKTSIQVQELCNDDDVTPHLTQDALDTTSDLAFSLTENLEATNGIKTNESYDFDPLKEVKERALALLDTCASGPRRRRVRRRRPRRAPQTAPDSHDAPQPDLHPDIEAHSAQEYKLTGLVNSGHQPNTIMEQVTSFHKSVPCRSSPRTCSILSPPSSPRVFAASLLQTPIAPSSPAWLTSDVTAAPSVVRNETVAQRVPRLVRPLEHVSVALPN